MLLDVNQSLPTFFVTNQQARPKLSFSSETWEEKKERKGHEGGRNVVKARYILKVLQFCPEAQNGANFSTSFQGLQRTDSLNFSHLRLF